MKKWFADPDTWVGVFQNMDLGHPRCEEKCAFPFALSDGSFDKAKEGETRAPDGKAIGLGWRYLLQKKCRSVEEVLEAMK